MGKVISVRLTFHPGKEKNCFLPQVTARLSLRAGISTAVKIIFPSGLTIQRKVFLIKKFGSKSLARLWKPVVLPLKTLMKLLLTGRTNMLGKESCCSNLTIQAFDSFICHQNCHASSEFFVTFLSTFKCSDHYIINIRMQFFFDMITIRELLFILNFVSLLQKVASYRGQGRRKGDFGAATWFLKPGNRILRASTFV